MGPLQWRVKLNFLSVGLEEYEVAKQPQIKNVIVLGSINDTRLLYAIRKYAQELNQKFVLIPLRSRNGSVVNNASESLLIVASNPFRSNDPIQVIDATIDFVTQYKFKKVIYLDTFRPGLGGDYYQHLKKILKARLKNTNNLTSISIPFLIGPEQAHEMRINQKFCYADDICTALKTGASDVGQYGQKSLTAYEANMLKVVRWIFWRSEVKRPASNLVLKILERSVLLIFFLPLTSTAYLKAV